MKYYWHGNMLLEEWKNFNELQSLKIASAYFSEFGLDLIQEIVSKNNLSKDKVELFLSPLFSYQQPGDLLDKAREISTVYIVESIPFHAKVYWIKTKSGDERVVFGSSNFTRGGFERNLEFDLIKDIQGLEEAKKFEMFFDFCRNNSIQVNDAMIDTYRRNEKELTELQRIEAQIKKKMLAHSKLEDPFDDSTYDLHDFYFKYEDYELLFSRNQRRKDTNINNQREQLRDKLMRIHHSVYLSLIKPRLGLHCHKRAQNISSLIMPCEFNKNRVSWIGVRYGKSPEEVDYLNQDAGSKQDQFAFQKHACLQFSVTQSGFEVNLFHAVVNGAFDRSYVHEKLMKEPTYKNDLIAEIQQLKGEGFVWEIVDSQFDQVFTFVLDDRNADEFISFYNEHDKEGRESFLSYVFEPDRDEIKTPESIRKSVFDKMTLLLPLYNLMAFRCNYIWHSE